MGYMKNLDIRIRSGGDDAIAAACELADLAKARRGYDDTMQAVEDITDVVTVLRGVGFSSVAPEAGDSASLLHRVVMAAADEIEHLRNERRWVPVSERLPDRDANVLAVWHDGERRRVSELLFVDYSEPGEPSHPEWVWEVQRIPHSLVTHWMPLPEPPELT
jgi:hypothetical protein